MNQTPRWPGAALGLYLAAGWAAAPLARPLLARRLGRGKEEAARLPERLGEAGQPRPEGRLVWLHGASLGETASMAPLIEALLDRDDAPAVLVTAGTVSAARRLAMTLPPGARHQYVPVDTAPAVRRFLAHWRPDLAIWVESEFWPGLMWRTARAGVPMMLVNARVSAASARAWGRVPGMARRLLGLFAGIATQDRETLDRLRALGAPAGRIRHAGNLKALIPPPAAPAGAVEAARAALAGRPAWLAASTHEGEEAAVLDAHRRLAESHPGLVTILAPRHPERAGEIAALAGGLALARRSRGEGPPPGGVWLADTLGEMGLWYRLAPVAFVGGSLVARGGHNPFEPAALGAAILHGPHTANFAPAYAALAAVGGAQAVEDGETLALAVAALMAPDGRPGPRHAAMTAAARTALAAEQPDVAALAAEAMALMASTSPGPAP